MIAHEKNRLVLSTWDSSEKLHARYRNGGLPHVPGRVEGGYREDVVPDCKGHGCPPGVITKNDNKQSGRRGVLTRRPADTSRLIGPTNRHRCEANSGRRIRSAERLATRDVGGWADKGSA